MADVSGHLPPPPVSPPLHRDSWYPYSNGGSHFNSGIAVVLIFVFSAVICALAINTAIRFFLRSADQQPPPPNQDDGGKVTNSSDPSSLLVFPTVVFSSESKTKLAGGGECAICLSEFTEGERVSILPKCKHGFHEKCIQGWLFSHVSCPTCRTACKDNEDDQYDVEAPPPPAAAAEVIRDRADSGE